MNKTLNEIYGVFEKSTQYYYFSDEMLDVLDKNEKAYKWFSDWIYKSGPGSDERYVPDATSHDYIDDESLTSSEIEFVSKYFAEKNWVNTNEAKDPEKKMKYPVGTLIVVKGYGGDIEPGKEAWNGVIGEIRDINNDGTYSIRVTDVKKSKVLFTKKWAGREAEALKQMMNLSDKEFITIKALETETDSEILKGR